MCLGCPFLWWAAALGWVLLPLAGRSSGVLSGGLVGAAFDAVWLGGLPASCGVGARLRGCVSVSCPPPFFLRGGSACSSLCPPWSLAGARTGRHSVWLTGWLLVLPVCQRVERLCKLV